MLKNSSIFVCQFTICGNNRNYDFAFILTLYRSMSYDLIKEQIKSFTITEETIDDMKKERTRSTFSTKYVGQFVNDFKQGYGFMNYANSDYYEGNFKGKYGLLITLKSIKNLTLILF